MTTEHAENDSSVGTVILVGAGPGDPGLLTVKGLAALRRAEVLVYDYLADPSLLAHLPTGAERIYVGKQAGRHTLKQSEINALLVEKARDGRVVVRLKGGDPFVFGRGGEEAEELRAAGIPFEIVPGITSGIAAPAYAGIPVTHRGLACSVALITGHEDPTKADTQIRWEHLAHGVDTLVFYMGVGNLGLICAKLMEYGRRPDTPVAVIRWGTKPAQRTVTATLATIEEVVRREGIQPPSIIVVGEVVGLRETLNWYENRPLWGRRIVNTRSRSQASELSERLTVLGAEVVELPTIEIAVEPRGSALDRAAKQAGDYDWILFTSPNGVRAFLDRVLEQSGDIRALGEASIGCIGPGTAAAVRQYRLGVRVTARTAVAEGLVEELRDRGPWAGRRVLMPRAAEARDLLPQTLREWGATVEVTTAYRTGRPADTDAGLLDDIAAGAFDLITFSSSSTFSNFVELVGAQRFAAMRDSLRAASIGPVTSDTMRTHGVQPVIEAEEHTIPGLVRAIQEYCAS